MKKMLTLAILAISIGFISCSKDKNEKEEEETIPRSQLLMAAPWSHLRSTALINGVLQEAPYSSYDICLRDDPHYFLEGGMLQITQGALRCPGDADYTRQGQWALKDGDTKLSIALPGFVDWDIIKLTKDSLVISFNESGNVSTNYYAHKY